MIRTQATWWLWLCRDVAQMYYTKIEERSEGNEKGNERESME